jgi:hypothetical protein
MEKDKASAQTRREATLNEQKEACNTVTKLRVKNCTGTDNERKTQKKNQLKIFNPFRYEGFYTRAKGTEDEQFFKNCFDHATNQFKELNNNLSCK